MGSSTGECGKGHDKNARAHGGLQFITKYTRKDEQHHHAATCADKAADEADNGAADERLYSAFFRMDALHGFFGGHYGLDDEFYAEQEGHKDRKITHRLRGEKACDVAADNSEGKHARHHDKAVFDVEVFVFSIGVGRDCARQYVGRKRDANGHIRVHIKKGNEHGGDHRSGAHTSKASAEACAHAGEKGNKNSGKQSHFNASPIR